MDLKDVIVSDASGPLFLVPCLSELEAEALAARERRAGHTAVVSDHELRRINTFCQD